MVMMISMVSKLITKTYIVTIFTIIDDQDDDFDYMIITLAQVRAIIVKLIICKMLI